MRAECVKHFPLILSTKPHGAYISFVISIFKPWDLDLRFRNSMRVTHQNPTLKKYTFMVYNIIKPLRESGVVGWSEGAG